MIGRGDPGECPICGAAHTACTTDTGPIVVAQLPARDAAAEPIEPGPALVVDAIQRTLPPGPFSTGTYRRAKKP